MKPLLSQPVQRGNGTDDARTLRQWEPAEHQATYDGLQAFAARQRARMEQAQRVQREAVAKVRAIKAAKP
jgi:hypothetical protein